MRKKRTIERPENVRDSIGLTKAEAGDPEGVAQFLAFVSREMSSIGFFGRQPEKISWRLRGLAHDVKELGEFAAGYAEATRPLPLPGNRMADPISDGGKMKGKTAARGLVQGGRK